MNGLIGWSGFVGGNLRQQAEFDALFRSTDVDGLRGQSFDLLVCAGAPAEKWKANRDPEADLASIRRLCDALEATQARRFVLISTVDVFGTPAGVDEGTPPEPGHAYGKHRLLLEYLCAQRFGAEIVRLPALFGPGLKKNAVYDLIHGNQVDRIHPDSVFQFYDVTRLWEDVERAHRNGLRTMHLAPEPVTMREVARTAFGRELSPAPGVAPARYDVRTRHAALWGRNDGYVAGREAVLRDLALFAEAERAFASPGAS